MNNEAPLPPSLPVYEAPAPRPVAPIPTGLQVTKMPGTMNKMISKMLPKIGKLRMAKVPKMKGKMAVAKPKKLKVK